MSLSITPANQVFASQLRVASDANTQSESADDGASNTGSPRLQAGDTASSGKTKSSGSSGNTTVDQLQKRLQELQKQLQQEQRELAEAQQRRYSSDAERTATLMAIQSRIGTTSAAMQQTAAALAAAIRKAGGSGAGSMVSATA